MASFSYQREYFRFAKQYINQVPIIDGKRHGKDVNLYKLFVEQCLSLLRKNGLCGLVIPSGIYTDLGAMKLREMLFDNSQIKGLFCFENRKEIFEGVHRSYKFVILTLEKGPKTINFPAAFMRLDVNELEGFPQNKGLNISVDLIRKLSPDSLSVMEFNNAIDIEIAERLLRFPLLGEKVIDRWELELHREFNMTDDAYLFRIIRTTKALPLYEGKMIHQFSDTLAEPRFWINQTDGRKALIGKSKDNGQILGYQK